MSEECEPCGEMNGFARGHQPALGVDRPYARNENNSFYCYKCNVELDIIEVLKNGTRISIEYREKPTLAIEQ